MVLAKAVKKFILYATPIAVLVTILMASLNTSSTQTPFTLAAIKPGDPWLDNRGLPIQTHGGGILKVSDTFYWFGQDYSASNDLNLRYIGCYSSTNLINWTYQNQVVKLADPEKLGSGWVLERPRVYYNTPTKKFVLYAHIDNRSYGFAKVAIFICDTVDGNYQYVKSFRPLGHESRDLGQFIDNDGTAYLIFEDRFYGFRIARLSEDYLNVEKEMCLIQSRKEGSALLHYNGLYYIIVSELTSWAPNPNTYATAKSLAGPWSKFKDIAPPIKNTYGSQSSSLLQITGTKMTTVIFMADIWKPQTLWDSRYLWMPLEIGDGKLRLPEPRDWTLDVTTGTAKIKP